MDSVGMLLGVLESEPGDDAAWLALADALEEQGDPRGEATRLSVWLRRREAAERLTWEPHLRRLTSRGVRICTPRRLVPLAEGVDLEMVLIPPGTFLMGSPEEEPKRLHDENQHRVTLTRGFWLGIYPVTQVQWQAVKGSNPSRFPGPDRPVETVSWGECEEFCRHLSERLDRLLRLPTEAEWEYACRAGSQTPFSFGETISTDQANYDGNYTYNKGKVGTYREQTTPVDQFPANPWGLYDLHGNVREWCLDWYAPYPLEEVVDPTGPPSGSQRVLRGGSWITYPWSCRSAFRYHDQPEARDGYWGCRLVMAVD